MYVFTYVRNMYNCSNLPLYNFSLYSHVDYGQRLPLTRVYDLGAPLVSIPLTFQASLAHISIDVDAYLGILNNSLT